MCEGSRLTEAMRSVPFRLGRRDAAAMIFAVLISISIATIAPYPGHEWTLLIFSALPLVAMMRSHPHLVGVAMILSSVLIRIAFAGAAHTDTLDIAQSAAARALTGSNPYGVGYASSIPPGIPYPYGPLGLLWCCRANLWNSRARLAR